ncbi:MFS transporter [Streptacidiphilus jiangxiensis]|uniref:Predicted arabinose efflux permease, MFS family n=1 Tax=Streptacidiphilus jiangxiensis TaxID=235985 RepID=A0A1H7LSC8_STRJI|nr:MFS transporter [Streptacidiphilus jiangxiensis]SEL01852.1 Predicted arabinose efflux permease, MFS family [Streptacidiphilus jiangxiensis]
MGYLSVLRAPVVLRLLSGTLVGRLPAGMTVVAIALALHGAGASYAQIGLTTAAYAVSAAVGGPVLGRTVDRLGQPRVLLASAVVAATGYVLLALGPGSLALSLAGAALAGAFMPPLEPCLRALWPDIVAEEQLETAYALDSASQQVLYVAGPLLVAGIAALGSPGAALWLAAGLGLVGTLVVATAGPARAWRPAPRPVAVAGESRHHWLGPLRSPALVLLLLAFAGTGWSVGGQNILFVAYAQEHPGLPGGAGLLLALAALSGLLGALAYGAVRWKAPTATRTWAMAAGMAVCYLPLLAVPGPLGMSGAAALSGLGLAPLLAAAFVLIAELAPAGTTTEAFAWLVTVFSTGNALGSAASGAVVGGSLRSAALVACAGITVGALLLVACRRRLRPLGAAGAGAVAAAVAVAGEGADTRPENVHATA